MELREALAQISEIRLRMARAQIFRGYRAGPAAFSGLLAVVAAGLQHAFVPDPARAIAAYVGLWVGAAAVSAMTAGGAMVLYYRKESAPVERQTAWHAAEQFLPSVVAGALLTFAIARFAEASLWLLPGLWQILFALGLLASRRLLPRGLAAVALFYLATGTLCLALAQGEQAFSPWAMGLPFGVGQLVAAAVLHWTLERSDGC